jgi:hypothetical protein
MKTIVPFLSLAILPFLVSGQLITPKIIANFGVDADLSGNFFVSLPQAGSDDWFLYPGYTGPGNFVIDTTGAVTMVARYQTDANFRKIPFYRSMRFPPYSVINNRLLIDAVFIRDYHGDDSTIFTTGSSKNGISPQNWQCPVSGSIPDKNDILDMMVHVRRAGPNKTDSLWMFGGVSIEQTTGDRYFDFEMYQTDIYYDRASQRFYNYGPDAGHTSWTFDAGGNVITPGDIIFSASYGSSTLSSIEARIWVDRNTWMTVTPAGFNWTGAFDGANTGSQFGYASIGPKSAGNFYIGVESPANTWAGPFGLIRVDNSYTTSYIFGQYMEFGVNLTKIGLDPVTLLGGNACGMPFRRVLVKTRASTSFTAALKDFVGPFDFFLAPRSKVGSDMPAICDSNSVSKLYVTNPVSTSTYVWSTTDGVISGSNTGTSIFATSPGTYVVTQYLQAGCSPYATDTLTVLGFNYCKALRNNNLLDFSAVADNGFSRLKWSVSENKLTEYFVVERSLDGVNFTAVKQIDAEYNTASNGMIYHYDDDISGMKTGTVYYRVKMKEITRLEKYSHIARITKGGHDKTRLTMEVTPNPVKDFIYVYIQSAVQTSAVLTIYDQMGRLMRARSIMLQRGGNNIAMDAIAKLPPGIYYTTLQCRDEMVTQKLVVAR